MNNPLSELLYRHFTETRAQMLLECDELLQSYGVSDHIDEITSLLNTPISEDHTQLTLELDGIFKDSCHHVLLSLFIVPVTSDLSIYVDLIKGMYKLENSFDSGMIIEIIDDGHDILDTKELLTELLEKVADLDWAYIQESIVEVRGSVIDLLRTVHENKLLDSPEEHESLMDSVRLAAATNYFTNNPDTLTQEKITEGILTVPANEETVLAVLTPILYGLRDPTDIAKELLGMAVILPITIASAPTQAKKFNNAIFVDEHLIMNVTLKIDTIVRHLPIFTKA